MESAQPDLELSSLGSWFFASSNASWLPQDRLMTLVAGISQSNPICRFAISLSNSSACMNERREAARNGRLRRSRTCLIEPAGLVSTRSS